MYKSILFLLCLPLLISSCNNKEDAILPATIKDILIDPSSPLPSTSVTVSATVKDSKGVSSAKLYYAVGSGNFMLVNMIADGDTYRGIIPAQKGSSLIQYYIEVVNTSSLISYGPSGAPATTATYQVGSPPLINNIKIIPTAPVATDNVSVSATITDSKSVSTAKLFYKVDNGSYISLSMSASSSTYSASIPAQAAGSVISYYIEAVNSQTISAIEPVTAPAVTATYLVNSIFMNEVWSWGVAPDFDWIELYNSAAKSVNIGGYMIYDSGGQADATLKIRIPDGTIIPSKGFYTLVVDDPSLTPNFGLKQKGEELWLENASGTIIDNFVFDVTTVATQSYGRKPDGSGNFYVFTVTTKNASNNSATTLK